MLKFTPKRRLTGGVRLAANKSQSTAHSIKRRLIPAQLIVSTRQQQGPAARPIVEVGQKVMGGETIARADLPDGTDVHAPTSGRISAIEDRNAPLSSAVSEELCIVIETDGADRSMKNFGPIELAETRAEGIQQIASAGIVGLGGAAFSTAAKIKSEQGVQCELLIINGAECEPYISCDDMLMREAAEEILDGAEILRKLIQAKACIIAIERDKPQAIDAITAAAEKLDFDGLRIAELPSVYPAGGERQLIEVLTGVEVPSSNYPSDVGYLCQNVGTAYAIHRYFRSGEPLSSRIVTVTGGATQEPRNIEALIGTPIADLIDACGGYRGEATRLIHGGSMMGYELGDDSLPITMATNCVIAATFSEVNNDKREWPCIRCGECSIACPARLQPQDLILAARESNTQALTDLSLNECIECGCCDVVCPSHIPLTRVFHNAKPSVRELAEMHSFSDASDLRFQLHEQRRQDATISEDHQRNEIKRTLSQEEQRAEEIRAAVERARQRKAETDGS